MLKKKVKLKVRILICNLSLKELVKSALGNITYVSVKPGQFLKKDSCTSTSESSEEKVQRAKGKLQDYLYPESHV